MAETAYVAAASDESGPPALSNRAEQVVFAIILLGLLVFALDQRQSAASRPVWSRTRRGPGNPS